MGVRATAGNGFWERIERIVPAIVLVVSLSGCGRTTKTIETPGHQVFLPAIRIHRDCWWLVQHADYVQAVQRCQARVWREHVEQARVLMPDDCVAPEPEDFVPGPTETPVCEP